MGQIHKGDVGTTLRVTVTENGAPFDASGSVVKMMKLKTPSGLVSGKDAAFETDGKDGVVIYKTLVGDLSEAGPWQGQVFFEGPGGAWHTGMFSFSVAENLILNPPVVVPPVVLVVSRRVGEAMATEIRKVGRVVALRNFDAGHQVSGSPKSSQVQPARITVVGAGTTVTAKVLATGGATYASIPKWTRTTPSVMGWSRT